MALFKGRGRSRGEGDKTEGEKGLFGTLRTVISYNSPDGGGEEVYESPQDLLEDPDFYGEGEDDPEDCPEDRKSVV